MQRGLPIATPIQILAIRREYDQGVLNPRAWADALRCSPETVRKIARRDTYREVGDEVNAATPLGRGEGPGGGTAAEPTDAEIAESLRRVRAAVEAAAPTAKSVDEMVAEMQRARERRAQGGAGAETGAE